MTNTAHLTELGHSPDALAQRQADLLALLRQTAPEVLSDNQINIEKLKELLGQERIAPAEHYELNWAGKTEARREIQKTSSHTLRPDANNPAHAQHMLIEGENLEVLRVLQKSYYGKVKMIYIDPPYNTGHDFVYKDNFGNSVDNYKEQAGLAGQSNADTSGRYHSDWCSMMYPRLRLARELLTDDGVIFISIDDNEDRNLRILCDEVFGEANFVSQLIWERAYSPKNDAKYVSNSHDYVLVYAKSIERFVIGRLPRTDEANARYKNPDNDPRGVWKPSDLSVKTYSPDSDYPITTPSGRVVEPPAGRCWSLSKNEFLERLRDNRIWFGPDGDGVPRIKRFLTELKFDGMAPTSILFYKEVGHSQEGAKEVTSLLNGGYFNGPKPVRLLNRLLTLANTDNDSIVLDFFSGSATTAHAVMQLNAEDGGKRKFIMVQLPEKCEEGTEAAKAGYKNICEIGKERIRRAGKKILEELTAKDAKNTKEEGRGLFSVSDREMVRAFRGSKDLDVGFRVLKLDESNMKDVYFPASDYNKELVESIKNNIKEDRSDMDLLYGCLLEWGLPLSLPHTHEEIDGVTVHTYHGGALIACFADTVSDEVVKEIAKRKPLRAVFRDSSFADSPSKINVEEIFKLLAPGTSVKVI